MKRGLYVALGVIFLVIGVALAGLGTTIALSVGSDDALSTAPARVRGTGVAVVAEDFRVDTSSIPVPRDLGSFTLTVTARDGRAMFVGAAPHSADVDNYLTGAPYDVVVGSFDFNRNKYNHVTQALRQPGSSFKPFIYSAALEKGFTPATIINDAPLVFDASQTGSEPWEPKNFDGKFEGPMRLRTGLMKSKNLVSVRILQAITPQYAQDYITRFGFDAKYHPPYLTMALGAGNATPMQMAGAYAVFANGGYRVSPYFITRIEDAKGNLVAQARPERAGEGAERAIDERNAFIMTSLLQDVVRAGTAARAMQLGRSDLAGKTGTTNEFVDAWFCGFGTGLVAVTWIGFDNPHTLGHNETGAQAALPMWMSYIGKALKGVDERARNVPEGVVQVRINPETGLRDPDGRGIVDYFYQEFQPAERDSESAPLGVVPGNAKPPEEVKSQLF